MKIHKTVICVLIIALLVFCFAGCGGQDNDGDNNPTTPIEDNTKLEVTIGTETTYVTLYDNPTTKAFLDLLPLSINMTDLNRQEYYYNLPSSLPIEGELEYYYEEGDFTYWSGGWFVIYYQDNSNNNNIRSGFRSMGKIDDNGIQAFKNLSGQPVSVKVEKASFTASSKISDVINDKAFEDYGRLIFPVHSGYYSGDTLGNLSLTWYGSFNTAHTVEIVNYMKNQALSGKQVFYDIYTDAEKAADSRKADTGLFFFRGQQNAKFAVTCAGGGWAFVGAMHDSFPHALELSKRGYNAFAIIYRPGAQTAYEDLSRAISFIFEHAQELGVDTNGYSVWGGSAGARMAASIGSWGVAQYGGANVPKPSTVVMQYTGHTEYNTNGEPTTFVTVGKNDGIANYRTMEQRINNLKAMGTATEYHAYDGLGHGFGLGVGTIAEGWLDLAIQFWKKHANIQTIGAK